MTTSGSISFNYNLSQIVRAALRKLGVISARVTPNTQTIQDCSDQLNILVKALNATGLHIWTETEGTLFLQKGQYSYYLGSGTTDHCAETYSTTALLSSASAGATSIDVDSISGINASDYIGIALSSGYFQWTAVSGAPSGSTVGLAAPLTGVAASGGLVITYTTGLQRPLRVVGARRYVYSSTLETQMSLFARLDYRNQPNKTTLGTVTQIFYDPRGGTNTQGQMFVWPNPSDITSAVKFTWWRSVQDFSAASNTPDLPQEWLDALIWNLAFKMAPEYDCPPQRYAMIKEQAASSLDNVMGWDREPESVYFGNDFSQTA